MTLLSRLDPKKKQKVVLNLWCWGFLSITLIFYIFFQGWPIISSVIYSFMDWSGMTNEKAFVGLANYKELFQDKTYWNAFKNSFEFSVLNVPFTLFISLLLAYILNDAALKARSVYRTIFFLPVVTTASIVGIVMIFIFGATGPINWVITHLSHTKALGFLTNQKYAMYTVVAISVWKDCGTYMIYWIAGLQSVPRDMYEAASIDGASSARMFFKIVMPLMAPIAGIITVLCCINSLKVFDLVKTMTEGGPFYSTDVVGTFVYRTAFSSEVGLPRLGYASSGAILFGVTVIAIVCILDIVKNRLQESRNI